MKAKNIYIIFKNVLARSSEKLSNDTNNFDIQPGTAREILSDSVFDKSSSFIFSSW